MLDAHPGDEILVESLRAGDSSAFDELYVRYERRLYGYILRMVGEPGLAEDLFQDVFMTVLRDRSFDPSRGRFSAWLFRVARNRCISHMRGLARSRAGQRAYEERERDQRSDRGIEMSADDRRVWRAMQGLDEAQRQLLMLKQVGELTYREIAGLLGIAEGTVKSRLHTATVALRRRLNELELETS